MGGSTAVRFLIGTPAGGERANSPRFPDMVRSAALIQMSALDVPSCALNQNNRICKVANPDMFVVDRIVKFGAFGGFVFMALTCWLLAFDVAFVASMVANSAAKDILAPLIVGGALTKGIVIGAAIGIAGLARGTSKARTTGV